MTTSSYSYKWCDLGGSWHDGYPNSIQNCLKIEYCESGKTDYYDCTPPECQNNTPTTPGGQAVLDGIVQGTSGADIIDTAYSGDPQGDRIDANDQILAGEGVNDDIVLGLGGDDKIFSGKGNDDVYAGSGNDYVDGGSGNDVIYGDKGGSAPKTVITRESFEWDKAADQSQGWYDHNNSGTIDNGDHLGGFTQNTGSVNVSFGVVKTTGYGIDTTFTTDKQNVAGIVADGSPVADNSSLASELDSSGDKIEYKLDFDKPVSNVSFNINDIDGDGVVKVLAYDAQGNEINVDLTGGSKVTLKDTDGKFGVDTADSNGGYESDTSANYSVTVTVPGPVTKIVIIHSQDGYNDSGVNVTDVYFDAGTPIPDDTGAAGNDTLLGGAGHDTIFGEDGNDTLFGGSGDDKVYGGNGNDIIYGDRGVNTAPAPTGPNLIKNGSFEDTTGTTNMGGYYTGHSSIPQWTETNGKDIDVHYDDRGGVKPTDGKNWLDMAASPSNSVVGQNVAGVTAGTTYTLAFDAGDNVSSDDGTTQDNTITVKWGGQIVATINPTDGSMSHYEFNVTGGAGDGSNRLEFVGGGRLDNYGASIDSVSLVALSGNGDTGPDGKDYLVGGAGDDIIAGQGGDDSILTGTGRDVATGGTGNDTIDASGDGATSTGAASGARPAASYQNVLAGGAGDDTIIGGDGDDIITGDDDSRASGKTGEAFNAGADGRDVIYGGKGNDEIHTGSWADGEQGLGDTQTGVIGDVAYGGDGDDIVLGAGGDDKLYGDAGNDRMNGGAGLDHVYGGTGDDAIDGGAGNDFLYGGDDRDTFTGGAGDTVDGGAGGNDFDTLVLPDGTFYQNTGPGGTGAPVADADGNSFTGRIIFTDAQGNPTGGVIDYTEIEKIQGGTPANGAPDAMNDAFPVQSTELGGDNDGNVLANDTDPNGDTLTVVGVGAANTGVGTPIAGSNGGLITIKANGDVDFNANGDFNDLGLNDTRETSVTYTVSDGKGGFDTATVTFQVGGINDGTVFGTDGDDMMDPGYVDANGDKIDGNDAILPGDVGDDDLIYGLGGNDTINAGNGNDEVYGGTGNDSITGGAGNDTVFGDDGNDTLRGGAGNDTVFGGNGDDTEFGGDGNDTLYGGAGNDTLNGNDNDDLLYGGTGDDSLNGEGGNDTLYGDAGNDNIAGGRGNDTVYGGSGDDVIDTGNGIDARFDNPYPGIPGPLGQPDANPFDDRDVVYGGEGNDRITTGDDADSVYGGDGNDTIDTGSDNDYVEGGRGDDTIIGGEGVDIIYGNDGDDLIFGGLDNDTLDVVDFDADGNPVDKLPGNNQDTIYGGNGNDVIYGRDDADTIFGDAGDDLIYGGVDDDSIRGGAGNDTIYGDQGNDVLRGEDGQDIIFGGDGDDSIEGNRGDDTIYGDAGNDRLAGSQDDDLIFGGTGDDYIRGGDGFDTLYGGDGNDNVEGGTQDDEVYGGDGDDEIRGNGGSDTLYGGDGNDRIFTDGGRPNIPDQDYADDGLDADPDPFDSRDTVYGGAGNDFIRTGDDADLIFGGDGDDDIDGGIDNDTISSGDGADIVRGGLGSDRFTDASSGDVIIGGEDPDDSDIDTFNFDQATLDKIDRIVRNGGATATEELRESGTIYFKDGTTATFKEIEAPCFTPGTTIATPKGERLVEDLRPGDRIITRDNGIQEIAWVGSKEMTGKELAAKPHMKPILIKAGALGHGLPERDMLLSPNHRVLVASEKTQLYFEEREVLAAAKHMTGAQGIHTLDVMRTTYIHFMCERHEVVLSNGAWTETFHPGDYSLNGLGNSQRNEIFELFPELQTEAGLEGYQSARKALKKHEARLLMK